MAAHTWDAYFDPRFTFDTFPANTTVVDVGCGGGVILERLRISCPTAIGVEYDAKTAEDARRRGVPVVQGRAEELPFADRTIDGVICKVVLPYTDEAKAVAEWGRIMKPFATARISAQGLGYFLRYLLRGPGLKLRVYGARSIANGLWYGLSGRRFPGFWGDTIYQTPSRLRRHSARAGLELVEERFGARFLEQPVFIYHLLARRADE